MFEGTGEVAHWLRICTPLTEDPNLVLLAPILGNSKQLVNSSSRDSNGFLWPSLAPVLTYIYVPIHIIKNKITLKVRKIVLPISSFTVGLEGQDIYRNSPMLDMGSWKMREERSHGGGQPGLHCKTMSKN